MISFVPAARDGRTPHERARRFVEATRIFALAESLGGVESLCEVPSVMTHGSVQGSALEVPAALVRLSVGIEHPDDLVADVMQRARPGLSPAMAQRVVIVGGGFAGVSAAQELAKRLRRKHRLAGARGAVA